MRKEVPIMVDPSDDADMIRIRRLDRTAPIG